MSGHEPVDWDFAQRVAQRVTGHDPLASSYLHSSLEADFADATERAASLVAGFTGLEPRISAALGRVVDRHEWVALNLASFRRVLSPVTERFSDRLAASPLAGMTRRVAGAEAGVLIGWFGKRVLGQYDLLGGGTPGDASAGGSDNGAVYYVGPNVLALEKRHAFRPQAFRLWIALHEVTHLVQFTGVPWMRDYFLSLVDESLRLLDPDPARFARAARHVIDELRQGRNPLEGGGLIMIFATEEQRALLTRVQALMSILEGHGNYVMDRLGAEHVEGKDHMARVLRQRRTSQGVGRQVQKALGIELKLRQYTTGERFFDAVEHSAGTEALGALWTSPEALPSLEEIQHPRRWLERTKTVA